MVQEAPILKGKTVAITRALQQSSETAELIKQMGGKPYLIPTLEFKGLNNLSAVENFIKEINEGKVDYVIFMSVNVLKYLFESAESLGLENKLKKGLRKTKTVAVGPRTAKEMEEFKIQVDIIPEEYSSEGIAETLKKHGVSGKTILIPRARGASPTLKRKLKEWGGNVKEVYVYEQQIPRDITFRDKFLEDLISGKIDAIIFGSPQSVKNMFQIFAKKIPTEKLRKMLNAKLTIVAIGPATAKTLKEMGLRVDIIPNRYTFKEALKALAACYNS
ncbi:MAG: uroporphyrinogen-III synthase [Candidatus Bathyarchaeia archaeon]